MKTNKRKIAVATTGKNPTEIAANFKKMFSFSKNANSTNPVFVPFGDKDRPVVSGRNIEISMAEAIPVGPNNRIKIAANALQDLGLNKSPLMIVKAEADTSGPLVNKVLVDNKNKRITIIFKEVIRQTTDGTRDVKDEALRKAVTLVKNADSGSPTSVPMTTDDKLEITGDRLVINLKNALTGAKNRILIANGILKDTFGNYSSAIATSYIIADETGPALVTPPAVQANIRINSSDKIIEVSFNERVYNGSTKTSGGERALDLAKAIQYTLDADASSPVYKSLTATEKVLISSKKIRIVLGTALPAGKNFNVKIAAGALKDFAGNVNLAVTTNKFAVDTLGPKLR